MIEDILQLVRSISWVYIDEDAADACHCVQYREPAPIVGGPYADTIAAFDAVSHEGAGDNACLLLKLSIGKALVFKDAGDHLMIGLLGDDLVEMTMQSKTQ